MLKILLLVSFAFTLVASSCLAAEVNPQVDNPSTQVTDDSKLQRLWDATVKRSPDIQFALSRLEDPSLITNTKISRPYVTKGSSLDWACSLPMPMSVLNYQPQQLIEKVRETPKSSPISQQQYVILFAMAQNTFDRLKTRYEQYNCEVSNLKELLANPIANIPSTVEQEYLARKQQRDVDAAQERITLLQREMIDLAGESAVRQAFSKP